MASTGKQPFRWLLRWWVILGVVASSFLCWWGTGKYLMPRPVWSRTLPDRGYYLPLNQDAGGQLVVAAEMHPVGKSSFKAEALVILDGANGNTLHRTSIQNATFNYGDEVYQPRIVKDTVWRITRLYFPVINETRYQLLRWRFRTEASEQVMHTWKTAQSQIQWPVNSPIAVLIEFVPFYVYCADVLPHPLKFLVIEQLSRHSMLPRLNRCESWNVLNESGKPKHLATWKVPGDRYGHAPSITPDGKLSVHALEYGDFELALHHAKERGLSVYQGKELFELFRSKQRGVLFVDTATGSIVHHFKDTTIDRSAHSLGNRLFLFRSHRDRDDLKMTMTQIEEAAKDSNRNLFSNLFPATYRVFRMDSDGMKSVSLPEEVDQPHIHMHIWGNRIAGRKNELDEVTYLLLKYADGQMMLEKTIRVSDYYYQGWWIPGTEQYMNSPRPGWLSDRLTKVRDKLTWLQPWIDRWITTLENDRETTILDVSSGSLRTLTLSQIPCNFSSIVHSHLYMLDQVHRDKVTERVTLNAYELPLVLYSPWWQRAAACLPPALWLILLFRRRRR